MQTENNPPHKKKQWSTLEWAKYYLSKGFSIIPLQPHSKHPAWQLLPLEKDKKGNIVKDKQDRTHHTWNPYRERHPTDEELSKWFKNTKNNIALVHGPISGTMAIDLDEPEAIEFYNLNTPLKTPMFSTSTEGRFQVLLKYPNTPGKIQIRKDILGLENRQEGNYSAVPPSIGPVEEDKEKKGLKTGLQYKWVVSLEDAPLAELPQWLLETPTIQRPAQVRKPLTASEIAQQLLEAKEALTYIPADDYDVWLKMGMALHSTDTGDLAYEIWSEWSQTSDKFDQKQQDITWGHFKEKENQITLASLFALALKHGWKKGTIKPDQQQKLPQRPLIELIPTSVDIVNLDCNIEWLVNKLLPKQAITLLFGRGGIGKTWLALQKGSAIAEGNPFMGCGTQKTTVVYIGFEDPLSVLKERLNSLGTSLSLHIWHLSNEPPPPRLDRDWQNYKRLPKDTLLIFDTLRAAQRGDENSSKDMAIIIDHLKELREAGFTVLLLHHTPKSSDQIYKGSTAILDLVDHALCLEKIKGEEEPDLSSGVFRLGTKQKTRFEMTELFLSFTKKRGFEPAHDPQQQKCHELYELMEEIKDAGKKLLQTTVVEKAKEELGWGRPKILDILKKGEDYYWQKIKTKERGQKVFYQLRVLSDNLPIYRGQTKRQNILEPKQNPKQNHSETLATSILSNSFLPPKNNQTKPNTKGRSRGVLSDFENQEEDHSKEDDGVII